MSCTSLATPSPGEAALPREPWLSPSRQTEQLGLASVVCGPCKTQLSGPHGRCREAGGASDREPHSLGVSSLLHASFSQKQVLCKRWAGLFLRTACQRCDAVEGKGEEPDSGVTVTQCHDSTTENAPLRLPEGAGRAISRAALERGRAELLLGVDILSRRLLPDSPRKLKGLHTSERERVPDDPLYFLTNVTPGSLRSWLSGHLGPATPVS